MAELILDTIEGSEFELDLATLSGSRGVLVTGISGDPSTAIDQVYAACAAKGFQLGKLAKIAGKTAFLQRIAGKATSSDTFKVQLQFSNDNQFTPTAYVITSRGYTQPYTSNRLPGTRQALLIPTWQAKLAKGQFGPPAFVPSDLAVATFQYPMREIVVSGMKYGQPPDDSVYAGRIGATNIETFLGLPTGYWYVSNAETTESVYSGYYNYTAAAITKTIEDWSEVFTLFSSLLNKYVDLDPKMEQRVLSANYKYGTIDSDGGILRVGPFKPTSFRSLFGFTKSPGGGQPEFLNNALAPSSGQ